MENVSKRHLTTLQLTEVYTKKRSKKYNQEGYKRALIISNNFLIERVFAFALDTCVMFLPMGLWLLLMLMVFGGILPMSMYTVSQWLTFGLLVVSMLGFNAFLSCSSGGQTLGKYFFDLKVVGKNRKEAANGKLLAREVIGFGIPTIVLFIFTNVIGIAIYWVINFLFLLVHPSHISIIDAFLGLRIVVLRDYDEGTVEEATIMDDEVDIPTPMMTPILEPEVIPVPDVKDSKKDAVFGTIDLHMHSNFSDDGEFNVEELFQMASKQGLTTISICDHNSVKANAVAKRMSELYNIKYVPGVEFDCRFEKHNLRVLGYFIDHTNDIYKHLENEALKREKDASMMRVERFEEYTKLKVDVEELTKKNRFLKISESMIVRQVLENPKYIDEPILQPYLLEADRNIACRKMCKDLYGADGPCFVSVRSPKLEDILEVIHLTGGVAVLSWAKETMELGIDVFDQVIEKGMDGIEVFTPDYEEAEMAKLLKVAKEKKLFVTAGSDFHGERRPNIKMGQTGCPINAQGIVQRFIEAHETGQ